MSSRICCSATDPMFVPVVSTTRSTLMVVGRCAWATPNPVTSTSLNHPRLLVVQGTTAIDSGVSEVVTPGWRGEHGSTVSKPWSDRTQNT